MTAAPCTVTTYRFRNAPSKGHRYSVWARFCTGGYGVIPVLEWFATPEAALEAADEMEADGRFLGITVYSRSQEVADF